MKLMNIGSNQTQIRTSNGVVVLFSYKTPVAAFIPDQGYVRTNHKWSRTTSKHINKWIGIVGATATEVDQSVLDNLVGGI